MFKNSLLKLTNKIINRFGIYIIDDNAILQVLDVMLKKESEDVLEKIDILLKNM